MIIIIYLFKIDLESFISKKARDRDILDQKRDHDDRNSEVGEELNSFFQFSNFR